MKVRKRNKGNGYGAAYCPFEGPTQTAFEHARWKRKNRIAQLKRSLHRYRDCTNLPFYCHELHAYKLLQELNRPTEKSPVKKWESYVLELSEIIAHLEEARSFAHLVKRIKQEEEARRKETEK